jgi:NADP-dependent 3-hydroxy acid dehydrogenase YdfG
MSPAVIASEMTDLARELIQHLNQKEITMNTKTPNGNRVWLITGTSSGIGQELVRAVLKSGDHVVATSRRPETVVATFPEAGERLMAVAMDLRDPNQIGSVVKTAVERFGRIDVLVNNAGHGFVSAVEEADDAEIAAATELNVHGLVRVTRAVLPVSSTATWRA